MNGPKIDLATDLDPLFGNLCSVKAHLERSLFLVIIMLLAESNKLKIELYIFSFSFIKSKFPKISLKWDERLKSMEIKFLSKSMRSLGKYRILRFLVFVLWEPENLFGLDNVYKINLKQIRI